MIIICDNYIDGIFKTANFKFLNLNYILCYSHPRVTFPPPCIQSPEKSLYGYLSFQRCQVELGTKYIWSYHQLTYKYTCFKSK